MRASEAVRKMPVTVDVGATVGDVAGLMDSHAVGAVVVVDHDQPVGIVTDRDLVVRVLARNLPSDARIDSVMSTRLVTMPASWDMREATRIFAEQPFRRLPLVEGGRVVGMLTIDDLIIDAVSDMASLARPVTGQVLFGHPEPAAPGVPAERS